MAANSLFFCLPVLLLVAKSHGYKEHHQHQHPWSGRKLFVFGDSYVDTGNIGKGFAASWKTPYGITFPGKPTGRFSDGRVLTDFVAAHLGIRSPIPYKLRRVAGSRKGFGMNFAYGGTGVFDTLVNLPNMTTQIDMFRQLIELGVYRKHGLRHSIALVSVAGNDYSAFLARNGTLEGLRALVGLVVNQTSLNMERIIALGVGRIAVEALPPAGCLPDITVKSNFSYCIDAYNQLVLYHNVLLRGAVAAVNARRRQPDGSAPVIVLDLYTSFMSAIRESKFSTPLEPCCMSISSAGGCGKTDEEGNPLYRLCSSPDSTLFWDGVHPTQAGWSTIMKPLLPTLRTLLAT